MKFEKFLFEFENNDDIALIYNNEYYSYKELLERINFFDVFIKKSRIKNKIIAHRLNYSLNSIALFLAILKNNNIVIPLYQIKEFEETKNLKISEPNYIIEVDDFGKINLIKKNIICKNKMIKECLKKNIKGIVLFSSGTSGVPKGILHNFEKLIPKTDEKRRKKIKSLSFLLFDHIGGLNTLLFQMVNKGSIVLINNRNPEFIGEMISKHKVELLPTTPSFLNIFLLSEVFKKYNLKSLKIISYGTEVMPDSTLKILKGVFPEVKLKQTYGLSETGIISSKDKMDEDNWIRLNSDTVKSKIINDILYIKTKTAMIGYLNSPSPFDNEGWFNTQDRIIIKDDFYKILGRDSDLINIGGQKVFPYEIENLILEMSEIEDVLIYPIKNFLLGNVLGAKIKVFNCDRTNVEIKRLVQSYLKNKVVEYKIPIKFEIVNEILINKRMKKNRTEESL